MIFPLSSIYYIRLNSKVVYYFDSLLRSWLFFCLCTPFDFVSKTSKLLFLFFVLFSQFGLSKNFWFFFTGNISTNIPQPPNWGNSLSKNLSLMIWRILLLSWFLLINLHEGSCLLIRLLLDQLRVDLWESIHLVEWLMIGVLIAGVPWVFSLVIWLVSVRVSLVLQHLNLLNLYEILNCAAVFRFSLLLCLVCIWLSWELLINKSLWNFRVSIFPHIYRHPFTRSVSFCYHNSTIHPQLLTDQLLFKLYFNINLPLGLIFCLFLSRTCHNETTFFSDKLLLSAIIWTLLGLLRNLLRSLSL